MAYRGNHLGLHEELTLLALEDRKGTFQWKTWGFVVGGAILVELLLNDRVRFAEGAKPEKNPFVELVDDEPLGCPVLDEALERVATASRRARLGDWIGRFAHRKGVQHEIARQLCRRGILREDETSAMLFFKRKVFPEVNPVPERKLIDRLDRAVFGDQEVDERTALLVVLAQTGGLLEIPFEKQRLRGRKQRLEGLAEQSALAASMRRAIEQLNGAMTAAIITSTS